MPNHEAGGPLSPYRPQERVYPQAAPMYPGPQMDPGGDSEGWELLCKVWRRKWVVIGVCLGFVIVAAVAAASIAPRYSTEARVLIGLQEPKVTEIQSVMESVAPDADTVRTESYVIASRNMARQVGEHLALDESPVFNPALQKDRSLVETLGLKDTIDAVKSTVADLIGGAAEGEVDAAPSEEMRNASLWAGIESLLLSRVEVEPLNRSHVLTIKAETEDPMLSAQVANAFADLYTQQKLSAKSTAADKANAWLETRLDELRGKVETSERAVEKYRREHGLFATKSDTVIGQQMSGLNDRLVEAESAMVEAETRLMQAEGLKGRAGALQSVPAVLQSQQILALRNQKAELERQSAELASDYTAKHPNMRRIQAQVADVDAAINAEIDRIVASLQNELKIARGNYSRVVSRMEEVKGEMGQSNSEEVALRQLEREAQANRSLYESLLSRSKETMYQAGMVTPTAEVVSRAPLPTSPSFPPKTLILALGALIGLGLGVLIALLIEKLDQTFRTPEEIENLTGLPSLAVLPSVRLRRSGRCDHVLKHPHSVFTDGLRMLEAQLALDDRHGPIPGVTIFTSAAPGEGKSHTSCSYAQLMASEGRKVVLIDLDWRQPTQHRLFGQRFRRSGIVDLLNGDVTPEEVMYRDDESGVHAFFAGRTSRMRGDTISLERIQGLLEMLSRHFDVVVVDTSPLRVTPEVLHLARLADHVVINVKWGSTKRQTVLAEVKNLVRAGARLSGIVLTQVEPKRYRQYSYGRGTPLHQGYLAFSE